MSKFPSKETFKNKKTKPHQFIETFLGYDSFFLQKNIFPKKVRGCYVYDVVGQKFVDFFLDYGRLYLGFSDKYLTKMLKNYLKSTVFSYSNGMFTYRFLKLLDDITGNRFRSFKFVREFELSEVIRKLVGDNFYVNNDFLKEFLRAERSDNFDVFEPFDDSFSPIRSEKRSKVLFLGRGIRYSEVIDMLREVDVDFIVFGFGRFYGIIGDKIESIETRISEFEAVLGYYYTIRETFLVRKKINKLWSLVRRWLYKFVDLGISDINPYSIKFKSELPEFFNQSLLEEGILSCGNTLYFSYQHEENDFRRLRRKLNQVLGLTT